MTAFRVLSFVDMIDESGLENVIYSFSPIYQNVTPKHKKKMKLVLVGSEKTAEIQNLIRQEKLEDAVSFEILPKNQEKDQFIKAASVVIIPSGNLKRNLIKDCFKYGVPIITFFNEYVAEYINNRCGLLIRSKTKEVNTELFTEKLKMLYFDPEVQKILQRGALDQFQELFNWGRASQSEIRAFNNF